MWRRLERIPGLQRKGPLSRYLDTYNLLAVGEYESRGGTSDFRLQMYKVWTQDFWFLISDLIMACRCSSRSYVLIRFRLLSKVTPSWIHLLVHWKSLTNDYLSYATNETWNRRYPDGLEWLGTEFGESGAFLFPDASQISEMVGDRSRQMKFVPSGTSAMDFAHYQSSKLLGSSAPTTHKHGTSGTDE